MIRHTLFPEIHFQSDKSPSNVRNVRLPHPVESPSSFLPTPQISPNRSNDHPTYKYEENVKNDESLLN